MLCLFFLCAMMARTKRRTGKLLRVTTLVMTTETRSTSSVSECVLGSDFKGFFFPRWAEVLFPTYFVFASDRQYPSRVGPR